MQLDPRLLAALVAVLVLSVAGVASAEEIALKPRYEPGDSYVLSLQTTTQTAVRSKSTRRKPFDEDVRLEYGARVVVLEIDGHGRPVRERHEEVRLAFTRPGEAGSLFAEHAAFEVRRGGDGEIRLFANEKRVERAIEKIVADLLASQFEYLARAPCSSTPVTRSRSANPGSWTDPWPAASCANGACASSSSKGPPRRPSSSRPAPAPSPPS